MHFVYIYIIYYFRVICQAVFSFSRLSCDMHLLPADRLKPAERLKIGIAYTDSVPPIVNRGHHHAFHSLTMPDIMYYTDNEIWHSF